MKKTILLYALGLGAAAFLLQWLELNYSMRTFSTEWYIGIVALLFAALGAWLALRLVPAPQRQDFLPNSKAIESVGLTTRECEVLDLLAEGQSYKEIARTLGLTPNTVKTHVASVYRKLDVTRRTQAIRRARLLSVIP
jgi:DNA-binding NarL/FixJ family response regulator